MKRLNVKVLVILGLLLGVGAAGAGALWKVRWNSQTQQFLAGAREGAETLKKGEIRDPDKVRELFDRTMENYTKYSGRRPGDEEIRRELTFFSADFGNYDQVTMSTLRRIREKHPEDLDVLKRFTIGLLRQKEFKDAIANIDLILAKEPEDESFSRMRVETLRALARVDEIVPWLKSQIQQYPNNILFYTLEVDYYLRANRRDLVSEAEKTLNQMVRNNPESGKARLIRATYFQEQGAGVASDMITNTIRSDLTKAYELSPDDPLVLMRYAELLTSDPTIRDTAKAKELAEKAIRLDSTQELPYRVLASIQFATEDTAGGMATLDHGIEKAMLKDRLLETKVRMCLSRDDLAGARAAEKVLRDSGRMDWFVDYLSAFSDIAEKKNDDAVAKLQRAKNSVAKNNLRAAREVAMSLSRCHRQRNDIPSAIRTLQETVNNDRTWYMGRIVLAELLAGDEQFEQAARVQIEALQLPGADRSLWEGVVYWMLQSELRQNARMRNWNNFRETFALAKKLLPDSERLMLLEAWAYAVQGELILASQTLESMSSETSSQLSNQAVQVLLIETALRQNDLETAEQKIAKLAEEPENATIARVLEARLWIQRKDTDALKKIFGLLKNLDDVPEKDQANFAVQILKILWAMGGSSESLEGSKLVAERWPDNLDVQLGIFDAAIQMGDLATSDAAREAIRKLDGTGLFPLLADGITNMTLASREENVAKRISLYEQAGISFSKALAQRNDWGWAWFLMGRLQMSQEKYTEAATSFEKAILGGESNPAVYENILLTLNQNGYVAESQTILNHLSGRSSGEGDSRFQRIAALLALRQRRLTDAVQTAREVFGKMDREDMSPNSDCRWIAIVFSSMVSQNIQDNRTNTSEQSRLIQDAEYCFQRVMADPSSPLDIHLEYFRYLVLVGRRAEIPALLAQTVTTMPESDAIDLRANVALLLGDFEGAGGLFAKLLEREPYDLAYLREVTRFYIDMGRYELLLALTQKYMDSSETPAKVMRWARQNFAIAAMAMNRIDPLLREDAKKLIELNITEATSQRPDRLDLRLKAELFAADGQIASRRVALDIAGNLAKNYRPMVLDEQLLYARLLLLVGDRVNAERLYEELRVQYPDSTEVLSAYVAALLANREYAAAKIYSDQLLQKSPDSSLAVQYRLQRLFLTGEYDELVKETQRQLERLRTMPGVDYPAMCIAFGKLLSHYGTQPVDESLRGRLSKVMEESEACFRQAMQSDVNRSWAVPLASLLIRGGRVDEALSLIRSRSATGDETDCSSFLMDAGRVATSLTAAQSEEVETFIQETLTRFGRTFLTLGGLAEYRICQAKYAEAEAIYQEMLKANPNSLSTLNNLAYLWAVQKKSSDEALKLVDKAILYYGELIQLRDTRATVYIAMKEPEKAIAELEPQPTETLSVVNQFHRAVALLMLGRQSEAHTTFVDAKRSGLTPGMLRALELDVYRQLDGQLQ